MTETRMLTDINMVNDFILDNDLAFLYISTPNCSVCHALLPQVQHMLKRYPKIKLGHVDASVVKEVAGQFSVFTAPVLLLYVNGKEYIREARIVHTQLLDEKLNKLYTNITENK